MTVEKLESTIKKLSLLALLVFGFGEFAHADGETWLGGAPGNPNDWNTAANWTPMGVPTNGANVTIPGGLSFYPIVTTTISNAVKNLWISSGASLTIMPGGNLTVSKNSTIDGTLTISGGILSAANGNMEMNGVLNLSGGTLTIYNFAGTGTAAISGGTLQVGHAFTPPSAGYSVTGGTIEWLGAARFSSCCMRADGCAVLQLSGVGLRTYSIQASTDLKTWTNIGTATADAAGNCQFGDVNARNFSSRFYRAVYP